MFTQPIALTLPGSEIAIPQPELWQKQISLCQHAPAVTGGIDKILPFEGVGFIAKEDLSFKDPDELLCYGRPLPSYRQFIAQFSLLNDLLMSDQEVSDFFKDDRHIVTAVRLKDDIQWLHAAVDDRFFSFTCLSASTRRIKADMGLLLAT